MNEQHAWLDLMAIRDSIHHQVNSLFHELPHFVWFRNFGRSSDPISMSLWGLKSMQFLTHFNALIMTAEQHRYQRISETRPPSSQICIIRFIYGLGSPKP